MSRLNNLFPTDETIDMVKEYIQTNHIPPDIHSPRHFEKKYSKFIVNNDDVLEYEPLHLVVVKKENIKHILADLLKNDTNVIGK